MEKEKKPARKEKRKKPRRGEHLCQDPKKKVLLEEEKEVGPEGRKGEKRQVGILDTKERAGSNAPEYCPKWPSGKETRGGERKQCFEILGENSPPPAYRNGARGKKIRRPLVSEAGGTGTGRGGEEGGGSYRDLHGRDPIRASKPSPRRGVLNSLERWERKKKVHRIRDRELVRGSALHEERVRKADGRNGIGARRPWGSLRSRTKKKTGPSSNGLTQSARAQGGLFHRSESS